MALAVARGGAFNVFRAIECFLKIQKVELAAKDVPDVDEKAHLPLTVPKEVQTKDATPVPDPAKEIAPSESAEKVAREVRPEGDLVFGEAPSANVKGPDHDNTLRFKMASVAHLADTQPAKYPIVSTKQMHAGMC